MQLSRDESLVSQDAIVASWEGWFSVWIEQFNVDYISYLNVYMNKSQGQKEVTSSDPLAIA